MPSSATTHPEAQPPRRIRLRGRLAYLLLFALMGLFAYAYLHKSQEIRSLANQAANLRYQNQQTAANNKRLQHAISWYRTDQYIEETARADLGYTMPGEVSVESIPIQQHVVQVRAAPPPPPAPPAPTWQQWWNVLSQ